MNFSIDEQTPEAVHVMLRRNFDRIYNGNRYNKNLSYDINIFDNKKILFIHFYFK